MAETGRSAFVAVVLLDAAEDPVELARGHVHPAVLAQARHVDVERRPAGWALRVRARRSPDLGPADEGPVFRIGPLTLAASAEDFVRRGLRRHLEPDSPQPDRDRVELTVALDAGRLAFQDPRRLDRVAKALRAIGLDPVGQVVEHRIRDIGPDGPEVLGGPARVEGGVDQLEALEQRALGERGIVTDESAHGLAQAVVDDRAPVGALLFGVVAEQSGRALVRLLYPDVQDLPIEAAGGDDLAARRAAIVARGLERRATGGAA